MKVSSPIDGVNYHASGERTGQAISAALRRISSALCVSAIGVIGWRGKEAAPLVAAVICEAIERGASARENGEV